MILFSQPEEERLFNERHSQLLELLPRLNDTLDNVFKHKVMADREGLAVFMLGRRCANDFSEILLLASNCYGFAVAQHQGLLFLILILQLEVENYGWEESALEVQQFLDRFGSYLQSLNERKA